MEELIAVMGEIRDQLAELNNKIDVITGFGSNDITDIVESVRDIKGAIGYDLTDVCEKLDEIKLSLSTIDVSISCIG